MNDQYPIEIAVGDGNTLFLHDEDDEDERLLPLSETRCYFAADLETEIHFSDERSLDMMSSWRHQTEEIDNEHQYRHCRCSLLTFVVMTCSMLL